MSAKEGVLLNILNESLGRVARLSYLYKGSPASIIINKSKRNITVSESKIEIKQKLEVGVSEFPKDHLKDKQTREKLQQYLAEQIEEDMNEMMEKLQKVKSDAIGLGRIVRAYHPSLYKEVKEQIPQYIKML